MLFYLKNKKLTNEKIQMIGLYVSYILYSIYLTIIALADIYYRDQFTLHADKWLNGIICKIAAVMSSTAYLLSVIFLSIIAMVRCHTIKSSAKSSKIHGQFMNCIVLTICLFVAISSSVPLVFHASSNGQNLAFSGSLCLTIIPSAHSPWSIKVFSLVVTVMVLIFLICSVLSYVTILRYVKMTKCKVNQMADNSNVERGGENLILLFIVLITIINVLCLMPVFVASFMNIAGYHVPQSILNFIVIVALPLNSVMNPCFYTIRTHQFQEAVRHLFHI